MRRHIRRCRGRATVTTPEGKGTVVSANMLKMEVRVKIEKDGALVYRDFPLESVGFRRPNDAEREDDEEKNPEKPGEK